MISFTRQQQQQQQQHQQNSTFTFSTKHYIMNTLSSVAFFLPLLLWTILLLLPLTESYEIYVRNKCNYKVKIAIRVKSVTTNDWVSICTWYFDKGESSYLNTNGDRVETANRYWYYYAETYDTSCDVSWYGNNRKKCGSRTYSMKEKSSVVDGNLYLALTCNHPSWSQRRFLENNATDVIEMYDEPPEMMTADDILEMEMTKDKAIEPDCPKRGKGAPWYCDGKSHRVFDDKVLEGEEDVDDDGK